MFESTSFLNNPFLIMTRTYEIRTLYLAIPIQSTDGTSMRFVDIKLSSTPFKEDFYKNGCAQLLTEMSCLESFSPWIPERILSVSLHTFIPNSSRGICHYDLDIRNESLIRTVRTIVAHAIDLVRYIDDDDLPKCASSGDAVVFVNITVDKKPRMISASVTEMVTYAKYLLEL